MTKLDIVNVNLTICYLVILGIYMRVFTIKKDI